MLFYELLKTFCMIFNAFILQKLNELFLIIKVKSLRNSKHKIFKFCEIA